jgi:3'-phosphoadenosine 5'-phosphosulfate sulfotransferase (PAPS reductase)/FAD synthetase
MGGLMEKIKRLVGFSGGIDSQATARWVCNRYGDEDTILLNTRAGRNESPITDQFIETYSATVHHVITIVPLLKDLWKTEGFAETRGLNGEDELTFAGLIKIKGRPPSRKAQFCTQYLKLVPQKRWIQENFSPGGKFEGWSFERYIGVRRDESNNRKNQSYSEWDDYFDSQLHSPITDWTKKMCFDYVEAHGEEYNSLYRLGFSRIGCAPCINSSKDDVLLWVDRFPEMIDKVREYERDSGHTFFAPCIPGAVMNTIDEVIEWAKTDRGGKQFNIFRGNIERPSCESKYGLCE